MAEHETVTLPDSLIEDVDEHVRERGFVDREEFIRAAVREAVAFPGPQAHLNGIRTHPQDPIRTIEWLCQAGLSPPQVLDYYFCEVQGYSQQEWADRRHVTHQAVSSRLQAAKETLDERKWEAD